MHVGRGGGGSFAVLDICPTMRHFVLIHFCSELIACLCNCDEVLLVGCVIEDSHRLACLHNSTVDEWFRWLHYHI